MGILNAVKDAKLTRLFTQMNDLDTRILFDLPITDCITMYDKLFKAFENSDFAEEIIDRNELFDLIVSLFEFDRYSIHFGILIAGDKNAGEDIKKEEIVANGILKKYLFEIGKHYNKNPDEILGVLNMVRSDIQNLNYTERAAYLASYILGNGEFNNDDYEEIVQLVSKVIDPQYQYNTSIPCAFPFYNLVSKF